MTAPTVASLRLVATPRHLVPASAARGEHARARTYRSFVEGMAQRRSPALSPAPAHTSRLLAARALSRLPAGRLRIPEEPPARVALAAAVDRAIARLRRAGTTPDHLVAVGSKTALLLADLLADVDAGLADAALYDERGAAGILARSLGRGAPIRERQLAITSIVAWEPDDCALLEALHASMRASGGRGVTLELPRLAGPIAHAFGDATAPIAEPLERRWASLDDAPEIAWREAASGTPERVIAAKDLEGEARAVVARIVDALAAGTAPERIAVVVPDLHEPRLAPLRAILQDAGVPFAEPRGRPVASCPEGRVALALLTMAAGPVTRDQTIELLRAPGLHPGPWMERAQAGDAMRRAVTLAHRLREVPVEVDRTGRLLVDALTDATRGRADETWMPRALERMLKEVRWTAAPVTMGAPPSTPRDETPAPRREVARRLGAIIDRVGLGRPTMDEIAAALPRDEARSGMAMGSLALRAAGDSAAAVRALREVLRSLVAGARAAGLDGEPVSAAELAAELSLAIDELGIGLGTSDTGAVRIGRPGDIAGLTHELVIVTGLDGRAYGGAEGGSALLDERTRRLLPAASRPPSTRQRESWRRAELAWAMAGSDHVVLTHAAAEGAIATPHDLVRWALDEGATAVDEPASRVSPRARCPDDRAAELVALAAGGTPAADVTARAAAERARTAFFLYPRTPAAEHTGRVMTRDPKRFVAMVGGDATDSPIAVTAIERAAGCAFAGFARRVLRVRRVEDLGESADARDRGTLVHRALHAAFEGARDAPTRAEALVRARAASERALGAASALAPLRREAVVAAVSDAVGAVERALEPGETLRFLHAEQRFGPPFTLVEGAQEAWPALAIAGDEPGEPVVYVDGQIDRIDATADRRRARVVDYKTGRLPAASEHGRRVFQLPLYAAVAARALGCDEVEAVYVGLRPRGVLQEWPRSGEDRRLFGAERDTIAKAARRVVLAMWEGDASPRPATATMCTRCEARDVCRRPAVAPIEETDEHS